ncbi:hypothetical protein OCO53_14540 [Peribacillus frigoritolerans]|nr:transposase [Peribacillus frigoritolerans]MCU6601689.1 hypothetical protein [Peribacillus frigoritolerans]
MYSTTYKEGYREYKSPKQICATSSSLSQCTKRISKSRDTAYLSNICGRGIHLRHHLDVKTIYAKRKETIERVFADAKE